MLTYILIDVVILFVIFTIFSKLSDQSEDAKEVKTESDDYKHYVKKPYMMSIAEHEFFKALKEAVQDKYYIVPQVQLSKIVEVNHYEHNKRKYFNKIDRKSVDFVLFNKEYFTPYMVIELDDSSHMLPTRESRDEFVNAVLEKIGIKVIRIPVAKNYELSGVFTKTD